MDEQNAVFCSRVLIPVNCIGSNILQSSATLCAMTGGLYDANGIRKYLVARERAAFVKAALNEEQSLAAFCLTLAITGARISEVLALVGKSIDVGDECVVIRTLKQREKVKFRSIPIPQPLLILLVELGKGRSNRRLWPFRRTYAWRAVKSIMSSAGICDAQCMPKALRHAFAIEAVLNGVPLNILQRWMGHARMETTAVYANVLGQEERKLIGRTWMLLDNLPVTKLSPVIM